MNTYLSETIQDKTHLFQVWEQEQKRFKELFGNLSSDELEKEAITSGCRHTLGQHILCMLGWMETAIIYFDARKHNQKTPKVGKVISFTNKLLKKYENPSYPTIWKRLEETNNKFRKTIDECDKNELFGDKDMWEWLVWSTFGHYDEHSTELEDQLIGKTSISEDKGWLAGKS